MEAPSLSIVCAVNDYLEDADAWFRALASQTLDDYEVVIVDAELSDDYRPALDRFLSGYEGTVSLRYLRIAPGGRATALNYGIEQSSGDVVLFLGDDFVPDRRLAETHARFHVAHPNPTDVAIGPALLVPAYRSRFSEWLESSGRLFGVPFHKGMTSVPEDFFYIGNASVKRSFLISVGGFDESFPHHAWDDYEIGLRLREAGMTAHFLPSATAAHYHRLTLRIRSVAMRRAGRSARIFEARRPGPHQWTPVVARAPWRHRLAALKRLARFALRRESLDLERFYARVLDASFSAGYRDEVAAIAERGQAQVAREASTRSS